MMKNKTYNIVLAGISAALIAVCAWIAIPVGAVPITLSTLGIFLILMSEGFKRGTAAIAVYLLLGLVGIPVFSNFKGGPAVLVGPTGGFLIGYIPMALVFALLVKILRVRTMTGFKKILFNILSAVCSEIVLYLFGCVWLMLTSGNKDVMNVLSVCVLPFIIPDIVKITVASLVSQRLAKFIKQEE